MSSLEANWPVDLDPNTLCLTVDVEWAAPDVLGDLRQLFDRYGVRATFFVTHDGAETPGHERGLHPNFRRNGDTYRRLGGKSNEMTDEEINTYVISSTLDFAPEAKGLRTHSLFYDSTLLPIYHRLGLEYDCSYQMPFVSGLRPFWKQHEIVAIPTYYADHFDLMAGASELNVSALRLDRPGLKVFDFHPNIVFVNAASDAEYAATKNFYHDPERLLANRRPGRGIRTLLIDLLETINTQNIPTTTVGEVNDRWRNMAKWT